MEQQIEEFIGETRAEVEGRIRIIADSARHVTQILTAFRSRYPRVHVSLQSGNSEDVIERLRSYDAEIGICSTHPHNILIQIVAELGLIGLVFYIIGGVFVLLNFIRLLIIKNFSEECLSFYIITMGLVINFFPLIPGGNFFNNWISIVIYYNIGFYLYSYKKCILK